MGGYSSEYEISLKSGNVVYESLDKEIYNVFKVHIFKNKWVYIDSKEQEFNINKNERYIRIRPIFSYFVGATYIA